MVFGGFSEYKTGRLKNQSDLILFNRFKPSLHVRYDPKVMCDGLAGGISSLLRVNVA
jgi:hypothetical protein